MYKTCLFEAFSGELSPDLNSTTGPEGCFSFLRLQNNAKNQPKLMSMIIIDNVLHTVNTRASEPRELRTYRLKLCKLDPQYTKNLFSLESQTGYCKFFMINPVKDYVITKAGYEKKCTLLHWNNYTHFMY